MTSHASVLVVGGLVAVVVLSLILYWTSDRADPLGSGGSVVLYCAAGIKPPVEATARRYEAEYGAPVHIQYGGSGTLLSNIIVARRGDLYLAADDSYLEIAREKGLVREVIPLATMRPVIAVREGNPKQIRSIADLISTEGLRISLATPEAAAVGKAVRDALTPGGQWEALKQRVKVFKPTVNDVANDLDIGAADAVIVWDATARQYPEFEMIRVPELDGSVRTISIGILASSQRPAAALHFARYLGAPERGLEEFERFHYDPVDGDTWAHVPEIVLFSGGVNRLAVESTIREFAEREGVEVTRSYNGCGILVGEMKAGKLPDAYFACDTSFMTSVGEIFLDTEDVSETDMVILVPGGNPKNIRSLADLGREGLKIGVANPEQSALGALTQTLLAELGLRDAVNKNVRTQVPTADLLVNKIRTGSLDAVVVYEANTAMVRDTMEIIRIEHPAAKAVQPIAVSKGSRHKHLTARLVEALKSAESKQRFESAGFRWRVGGGSASGADTPRATN